MAHIVIIPVLKELTILKGKETKRKEIPSRVIAQLLRVLNSEGFKTTIVTAFIF